MQAFLLGKALSERAANQNKNRLRAVFSFMVDAFLRALLITMRPLVPCAFDFCVAA